METDPTAADVERAVHQLECGTSEEQLQAIDALDDMGPYGKLMRIGLTQRQAEIIMAAALKTYPVSNNLLDFGKTYRQKLLLTLCQSPHPSILPMLLDFYPKLDDQKTKWQALMLLSRFPQPEAATAWLNWYSTEFDAGLGSPPPFGQWSRNGLHAEILLPALVRFASCDDPWLADQWNSHIRGYLRHKLVGGQIVTTLIHELVQLFDKLLEFPVREPGSWMWDSDYFDLRWKVVSRAEILAYADDRALEVLARILTSQDPAVRLASAISTLKCGGSFSAAILEPVASWPETRHRLYLELHELGKAKIFPRHFAKQNLMAESDLASWLTHDGDPPPDRMKLVGKVSHEGNSFYAFEFDWADKLRIGISGPWPAKGLEKVPICGVGNEFEIRNSMPAEEQILQMLNSR